jgi:alkyl sulfatase BDS1-like metallo-beta-lactamase superfamily hydrolase
MMRQLGAEYLVPSHTRPLKGKKIVSETLEIYRDAILFVHDQTVRFMNLGYFLDDIVPRVHLPPHLATHPYLQVINNASQLCDTTYILCNSCDVL